MTTATPSRTRKGRGAMILAALALVAAACGSNLPAAQQGAQSASPGLGGSTVSTPLPPGATVKSNGQVVNKHGKVIGKIQGGTFVGSGGTNGGSGSGTGGTTSGSGGGTTSGGGGSGT